jgi:predicted dehydrogenase
MNLRPLRVAALGMGWWSDVLADAAKRSKDIEIVACFTRSEDKRRAFPPSLHGHYPASEEWQPPGFDIV